MFDGCCAARGEVSTDTSDKTQSADNPFVKNEKENPLVNGNGNGQENGAGKGSDDKRRGSSTVMAHEDRLAKELKDMKVVSMKQCLRHFLIFTMVLAGFRCKLFTIPVELFSFITMDDFVVGRPQRTEVRPTAFEDVYSQSTSFYRIVNPLNQYEELKNRTYAWADVAIKSSTQSKFRQPLNKHQLWSQVHLIAAMQTAVCTKQYKDWATLTAQAAPSKNPSEATKSAFLKARAEYDTCWIRLAALATGAILDMPSWQQVAANPGSQMICNGFPVAITNKTNPHYQSFMLSLLMKQLQAPPPVGVGLSKKGCYVYLATQYIAPGFGKPLCGGPCMVRNSTGHRNPGYTSPFYSATKQLSDLNKFRYALNQQIPGQYYPEKVQVDPTVKGIVGAKTQMINLSPPVLAMRAFAACIFMFTYDWDANPIDSTILPPARRSGIDGVGYYPNRIKGNWFFTYTWATALYGAEGYGLVPSSIISGMDIAAFATTARNTLYSLRFVQADTVSYINKTANSAFRYGYTAKSTSSMAFLTGGFYMRHIETSAMVMYAVDTKKFAASMTHCFKREPQNQVMNGVITKSPEITALEKTNPVGAMQIMLEYELFSQDSLQCVQQESWNVIRKAMEFAKARKDFAGKVLLDELMGEWAAMSNYVYNDPTHGPGRAFQFSHSANDKFGFLNMGCSKTLNWKQNVKANQTRAVIDWACTTETLKRCVDDPSYARKGAGSRCNDIIVYAPGMFATQSQEIGSGGKKPRTHTNKWFHAWSRFVSKAAFEEDVSSIQLFMITAAKTNKTKAGETFLTQLDVASLIVSEEKNEAIIALNAIWVIVTFLAGIFVFLEMVNYGLEDPAYFYQVVHTGFKFELLSLKEGHMATSDAAVRCCHDITDYTLFVIVLLLEIGVVMAEAAVPTTQVYAEWFWIDMVVIGGGRIFVVMLPRISHLGLLGILFNITSIIPTGLTALAGITSYIILATVSLVSIVEKSFEGADPDSMDLWYFISPVLTQIVCQVGVASWTVFCFWNAPSPWWEEALQITGHGMTRGMEVMCLKVVSPRWLCVAKTLESHEDNRSKEYVQISGKLVKRDHEDSTKIAPGSVLVMDPVPEEYVKSEAAVDLESLSETAGVHCMVSSDVPAVSEMGCGECLMFSLARLRQQHNKQGALFECMFLLGETLG